MPLIDSNERMLEYNFGRKYYYLFSNIGCKCFIWKQWKYNHDMNSVSYIEVNKNKYYNKGDIYYENNI